MAISNHVQQIANYIKKNISKGYTEDSLKWALVNQGYSRIEISKAFDFVHKELAKSIPKFQEKPKITHQIYDEYNNLLINTYNNNTKSFWKKILDFFK